MHLISLKYCNYDLRLGHHTNHGCLTNLSSLFWRWSTGGSHFSRENLGDEPKRWSVRADRITSNSIAHLPHVSFQFVYVISSQLSASKLCVGRSLDFIKGLVEGSNFLDSQQLYIYMIYRSTIYNEYFHCIWYFLDILILIHGHNGKHLTNVDEVHYSHIHLEVPVSRSREVRHRFHSKRINGQIHHWAFRFESGVIPRYYK